MRVLFLTLYPDIAASPRYRVTQFLPALRAQGLTCDVASAVSEDTYARRGTRRALWYHVEELRRRAAQISEANAYEVVVLQKALTSIGVRGMLGRLRRHAPRLVYDVDDAVHLAPPVALPARWRWAVQRDQILELMRDARLVLAGNAWLADVARGAGGVAEVFPTVVDTDRFCPAPSRLGGFRVGWIGSPSTATSLHIAALRNVEVHVMGAGGAHGIHGAQAHAWSLDAEVGFIQRLSVGLMPLPKDEWTRGKCALKALQYMACGVPCVATPYGAVTEIIEDGVNGLFANTPAAWREALARLRDDAFRTSLGEAARATVEARYSLRYAAPRMTTLLRQTAEHG